LFNILEPNLPFAVGPFDHLIPHDPCLLFVKYRMGWVDFGNKIPHLHVCLGL
jgi:hypothetical protein